MGGSSRWRGRWSAILLAAGAIGLLWGCESAGPSALEVGDCMDPPAVIGDIGDLRPKPCDQPHGGEVFLVEDYPEAGEYPGDAGFQAFVTDRCIPAYEAYTGVSLMTQDDMDVGWLPPSEEDWAAGRHRIVCFATPYEQGKQTTGSIRRL